MGCGCVVPNCKNRSGKEKKVHGFPSNLERRQSWIERIDRPNWIPNNSSRICEVIWVKTKYSRIGCSSVLCLKKKKDFRDSLNLNKVALCPAILFLNSWNENTTTYIFTQNKISKNLFLDTINSEIFRKGLDLIMQALIWRLFSMADRVRTYMFSICRPI